jgi:translation initiation factor IF-2
LGTRVHTLAKELGLDNKDLIAKCQALGLVRITKHMNSLSDGEVRMLREAIASESAPQAAPQAPSRRYGTVTPGSRPPRDLPPPPNRRPAPPPRPTQERESRPAREGEPRRESRPAREGEPRREGAPSRDTRPPRTDRRPPRPGQEPPVVPPPDDVKEGRRDSRHKGKKRTKQEEEADNLKRRRTKGHGKEPGGMTFTDFTVGGMYMNTVAGTGVDYQRRSRGPQPYGRRKRYGGKAAPAPAREVPPEERRATLTFPVTVRDLSAAIGVKVNEIIAALMANGVTATINAPIASELAEMIAIEHGWEITIREQESLEEEVEREAEAESTEDLKPRHPVMAMLGHVDHGKTSLLDRIREANVAGMETGGITQHIGAYHVRTQSGRHVTFLDTPGHEAFTAMRARGAQCTDVLILVVAADDGVMPQTEEAISHAKAAGVPVVVALNKIDLPGADPERVKPQLAAAGLEIEEWGGDVPCVEVSAATGQGIDDLLEMALLVAELKDLKANPNKAATGVVLEGHLAEGRGAVATVLVQEGTLRVGDVILAGATYGRVRSMQDERGTNLQEAGPSIPVQISGLNGVPEASDKVLAVEDLAKAREVAQLREQRARQASLIERTHVTLENLFGTLTAGRIAEVRVILKADVDGSLEPLKDKLNALSTDEVKITILHAAVGAINESDVLLADASDAIIIGFRVVAEGRARQLAEQKKVDLRCYQIIFQPVDDMRAALSGLLKPERRETIIGHAEVLQIFRHSRVGNIAGCQVTDGMIARDARVRVARDGIVIKDNGAIESLRRVKDDVRQVQAGTECGIKVENYDDIKEGDVIEAYRVEEIARTL